ncbi:hypothetical protein EJC49_09075, partial [Aquibium carbonis]
MAVFNPARNRSGTATLYMTATPGLKGEPSDVVYDGDGLSGVFAGSQGMRFLGCDTAEVAYRVPTGPTGFKSSQKIGGPLWQAYLDDPLAAGQWPAFTQPLHPLVEARFAAATGAGSAANHARHADDARAALIAMILDDRERIGIAPADFRVHVAVTHEVFDGYGRLLAFVNTSVKERELRPPLTYNERMIANGMAAPFFIWPNTDPFIGRPAVTDAALPPARLRKAAATGKLGLSRQ